MSHPQSQLSSSSGPSSASIASPASTAASTAASTSKGFTTALSDFALPLPLGPQPSAAPITIPSSPNCTRIARSGSLAYSPSKLSSHFTPQVDHNATIGLGVSNPTTVESSLAPPCSSPSLGDAWSASSFLLKRSTAASTCAPGPGPSSPGLATGSRVRRSSMLGREITPFHLDDEQGLPTVAPEPTICTEKQVGFEPLKIHSHRRDEHGDQDMQMDEDEPGTMGPPLSVPTTPPRSITRFSSSDSGAENGGTSGGSRPGSGSPGIMPISVSRSRSSSTVGGARAGSNTPSSVVRRAVSRRANLLPKDRGVLRVAASLQDEKRPQDSEIASEAKLQKRIGGEPMPAIPRTPRLCGISSSRIRSPYSGARGPATAASARVSRRWTWAWEDEDEDTFDVDSLGNVDDDLSSSDDDMGQATCESVVGMGMESDDEVAMLDEAQSNSGGNDEGTGSGSLPKNRHGSLWMGFRETKPYHHNHSHNHNHNHNHRASPGSDRLIRARTPGHVLPIELEMSPKMATASSWTRSAKRKMMMSGEDRYEPYATSVYKRRAVSPMTLVSGGGGSALVSPSLVAGTGCNTSTLPAPTPMSIPSPTHTFASYFSASPYKPSQLGSISRGGSPRPMTASGILHSCTNAIMSSSVSAVIPGSPSGPGTTSNKNTGSGPGYGSGALGLSIGTGGLGGVVSVGVGDVSLGEEIEGEEMDQGVRMLGLG